MAENNNFEIVPIGPSEIRRETFGHIVWRTREIYSMLSSITDDVQRRSFVNLQNRFVEIQVEMRRATSDATGRDRRRRGRIHRCVTRRFTSRQRVRCR